MFLAGVLTIAIAAGAETDGTFEQWVRDRVGPVVFAEGSSHSWGEVTQLATDVGARAVKTWVGASKPGEALQKLQTEPYRELVRGFQVVCFNVSPEYVVHGYTPGHIAPDMLDAVRQEWHDIALFLCCTRMYPDQVFLLSVGGELNVYLGTKDAYPDFPVAEYVNACHAGKEAALAALPEPDRARVYSVAELQGEKEFDRFAAQWAGQFETDLISLSYYLFFRDLRDCLSLLRQHMKPRGPFGADRLMLGEYGPSLETCNWNQAEHARWHDEILRTAFAERLQFAFFYEIADHEVVIKTGSHDGLVAWNPGPVHRLAWDYYESLYHGKSASLPSTDVYETAPRRQASNSEALPNLVAEHPAIVQADARPGDLVAFTAMVANRGAAGSKDTTVNFFVDDRLVSWVWLPPLAPQATQVVRSDQPDARFVWRARAGAHRLTVVVDGPGKNDETSKEDNTACLPFAIGGS